MVSWSGTLASRLQSPPSPAEGGGGGSSAAGKGGASAESVGSPESPLPAGKESRLGLG